MARGERHILYLAVFRASMGVEKLSGVWLGLGSGVRGGSSAAAFTASGRSSGSELVAADTRFSDIVFRMLFPASFVCKDGERFRLATQKSYSLAKV